MNIESKLKLNNMYFEKIEFSREENQPKNIDPKFSVKFENITDNRIKVYLCFKSEIEGEMKILVSLVGDFSIEENNNAELSSEQKKSLLEKNTTAILFPYLRSELTLLTTQPNLSVINIPPININSLLKELNK